MTKRVFSESYMDTMNYNGMIRQCTVFGRYAFLRDSSKNNLTVV